MHLEPTRAAGLAKLAAYSPRTGRFYAENRNTDRDTPTTSTLSPWLRHRLVTETEVIAAARDASGEASEKFVQEVAWRTYFKGHLEQHPSIWAAYNQGVRAGHNRLATESGLRRAHHDACLGQTGIDCFDHWAHQLAADGWLHNHARMWFASIWIFTLRLPWELGAAFFLRHLHDGDPASNTLSWRWVAGLHTRGKHYVARADNIARYSEGRFDPRGQLNETPDPLTEAIDHPRVPLSSADPLPDRFSLLLHAEDMNPENLDRAGDIGVLSADTAFAKAGLEDMIARLNRPVTRVTLADLPAWVAAQPIVATPWAPIGPTATQLQDLPLLRIRRAWDSAIWPYATAGYFKVKQRLPELLATLPAAP